MTLKFRANEWKIRGELNRWHIIFNLFNSLGLHDQKININYSINANNLKQKNKKEFRVNIYKSFTSLFCLKMKKKVNSTLKQKPPDPINYLDNRNFRDFTILIIIIICYARHYIPTYIYNCVIVLYILLLEID